VANKLKMANLKSTISVKGALALSWFIASSATCPASYAELLKGDISHSESRPALDSRLRVGEAFDKNAINVEGEQRLNFYQIPNWLAGVWDDGAVTRTCNIDYLTNKRDDSVVDTRWRNVTAHHGDLRDAQNQIWAEDRAPYVVSSETDTNRNFQQVSESFPIANSNQQVVFKSVTTSIDVLKSTNKIISVTENEDFITYTPVNENAVRWERSSKIFTPTGKPQGLKECHGIMTRIAPFTPSPNQAELAKDLASFLQHNGK
jgi:hypothetical protein